MRIELLYYPECPSHERVLELLRDALALEGIDAPIEVITKVPPTLHTPLMSGSNAISGITILGAILSAGAQHTTLSAVLGALAVALATINVVGGFLVTNRMLQMFKPSRRELPDRQVK